MRENCYKILGVKRNAEPPEILHSFLVHRLVLNPHGTCEDQAEYRKAKYAFDILYDPVRRSEHDAYLDSIAHSPRPPSSSPQPAVPRIQYQPLRAEGSASTQVQSPNSRIHDDFTPTLEPHRSGIKERRLYLFGDSEKGSNPPLATVDSRIAFPTIDSKYPWPTIKRKEAKENIASYFKTPKSPPENDEFPTKSEKSSPKSEKTSTKSEKTLPKSDKPPPKSENEQAPDKPIEPKRRPAKLQKKRPSP